VPATKVAMVLQTHQIIQEVKVVTCPTALLAVVHLAVALAQVTLVLALVAPSPVTLVTLLLLKGPAPNMVPQEADPVVQRRVVSAWRVSVDQRAEKVVQTVTRMHQANVWEAIQMVILEVTKTGTEVVSHTSVLTAIVRLLCTSNILNL
jgi:hypothetical protein